MPWSVAYTRPQRVACQDQETCIPAKVGSSVRLWMSAAVSFTHLLKVGEDAKQYAGYKVARE